MPMVEAWLAMTGAAPVPVPPPMPAVMKTMCAPSSTSMIWPVSSRAACSPISGFEPAPSPLVILSPICSCRAGLLMVDRTCRSVFTATNSTPFRSSSIMRLTALPPAPPTPMTLSTAPRFFSRPKVILMSSSMIPS